jgi:hypothetical protein
MGQINLPDNWIDKVRDLQRQIDDVRAAVGLASATITKGGLKLLQGAFLSMVNASGIEVFYVGPDGNGFQGIQMHRRTGSVVFTVQRDATSGDDFWALWEKGGHIVVSDDIQSGGLARPWLHIPMYALFSMAATSVYGYMNLPVSSVTTETDLWKGRIPLVLHPRIGLEGIWGAASGSNSSTYKLYVDNVVVGTWNETGIVDGVRGPFDISTLIERTDVQVKVTVTASGTGSVACQVYSCYTRQT